MYMNQEEKVKLSNLLPRLKGNHQVPAYSNKSVYASADKLAARKVLTTLMLTNSIKVNYA